MRYAFGMALEVVEVSILDRTTTTTNNLQVRGISRRDLVVGMCMMGWELF